MGYDVDVLFSVHVGHDSPKLERALGAYRPAAAAAGLDETRFSMLVERRMTRPNFIRDAAEDCRLTFGGSHPRFVDRDDGIAHQDLPAAGLLVRTLVEHDATSDFRRGLLMFQGDSKQRLTVVRLGVLMDDAGYDPLPGLPVGCWQVDLPSGWGAPEEEDLTEADLILEYAI